jgi:voltage-gated potassium channel
MATQEKLFDDLDRKNDRASAKERVFALLLTPELDHPLERYLNIGMMGLIALNVLAVILETEPSLYQPYQRFFDGFELFSVVVFTLEYLARLWTITLNPRFAHPVWGRLRFARQPLTLIDLLAILPFFLQIAFVGLPFVDLRFIRAVRLFRFFRLGKMGHYSRSITRLVEVIRKKKEELVITLFAGLILLVVAASLMYYLEHDAQPEAFSSIPSALWWGVVTLTTVGYGDIYPTTVLGKILSALISFLGIGLFALPAGIIASGFAAEIQTKTTDPVICPHCGKPINSGLDDHP